MLETLQIVAQTVSVTLIAVVLLDIRSYRRYLKETRDVLKKEIEREEMQANS